jgi:hypothetical protein
LIATGQAHSGSVCGIDAQRLLLTGIGAEAT